MNMKSLAAVFLAAMLLTGCRKADGSEHDTQPLQTEAASQTAAAEAVSETASTASAAPETTAPAASVTVNEADAKNDQPFAFDAASLTRPQNEICAALLYEKKSDDVLLAQSVNYYDADGNAYRYQKQLDFEDDDWLELLEEERKNGAEPVSRMSDTERDSLWYLTAHADEYASLEMKRRVTDTAVKGVYQFYIIKPDGEPLLLARYAHTAEYRYSKEVADFLNWFRYFYHGGFRYGE